MKRIDAILIALGVFLIGGFAYLLFRFFGLDSIDAGIWSQTVLVLGLICWVITYIVRVFTKNMTYHRQVRMYQEAFLAKQLEKMSPEELEKLMTDDNLQ
ncbi:MAG: DUF3007 family protein [Geminocystis sp.]|nr:DUF3007 family protein [Geminocystis sp.]HIK38653.1 DUF3007 family protein [Geminocystis sp. M7585_C2015_104]MCS7147617.1 DUF3007 family protein [Geminocystis sp.]MCX8078020.1 DUF3007 family protein [Geminocystis sp.]MDW8115310.1 DUF3007 family protein [Geminocystis sp.]